MCDAIVHRGPDDQGQFVDGPVGLGMRRLSIIDLAGGHQPMQNEDGSLTIVFNGEIYNYRDVRRQLESRGHTFRTASDTESILHAYEEYGPDCLRLLNGMFAIAIWDGPRQRLFLARDRLGIKPLYLQHDQTTLRFGSEIKAILVDPAVPRTLDPEAFRYFLRYGYVAAPGTMFASIRKLPPAHYLMVDRGSVTTHRYWEVRYGDASLSPAQHAESVAARLRSAVESQLVSDVPLGAFLSGGLDSTSIVHFMSEVTRAPVNTYSIGFTGEDRFHSELDDARLMAHRHETAHHEILVEPDVASLIPRLVHHLDEPLADSSFVVTYLVSKLARETVKVILSGVGGDEIYGGYRRYLGSRLAPYYSAIPEPVRHLLRSAAGVLPVDRGSRIRNYFRLGRSFILSQGLPAFEQYDHAVRLMSDEALRALCPESTRSDGELLATRREIFESVAETDAMTQAMHLDLLTSLPESLLLLTDKMTMATSLEARVPFLDHELVEAAALIPASVKVKGTRLRDVQKASMRGRLPDEVLTRRKRGFGFPIGAWFRRDLRPLVGDLLSPAHLSRQGLFDAHAVTRLVVDHQEFRQDYSDALLALLTFQLWWQEWCA
jgi:asparagine synthase (glutamine-hydrolysing)